MSLALASNPGGATLSGGAAVAAENGVATFPGLWLDRAATGYGLTASAAGLPSVTSAAFAVTPASAARLEIAGLPESVDAGAVATVSLAAYDAFGNLDVAYAATVTLSSTDAAAVLPTVQLSAGVAPAVAVTFRSPGAQVLTATDAANPGVSGSATTVVVGPDAPPSTPSDGSGCGCGSGAGSAGDLALFLALGLVWRGAVAPRGRRETSSSGG